MARKKAQRKERLAARRTERKERNANDVQHQELTTQLRELRTKVHKGKPNE